MHLSLNRIRRIGDGVHIYAPEGEVVLKQTETGISATYRRGPLVNGSAEAFTQNLKQKVLNEASQQKLPWKTRHDGSIEIMDHRQFHEQTFSAATHALETLKRWSQKAE